MLADYTTLSQEEGAPYMKRFVMLLLALPCLAGAQSLRGSAKKLSGDNAVASREHLSKIKNDSTIDRFVRSHLLIPIPNGSYGITVDPRLEENRRYCRPWTVRFLKTLGTSFEKRFHKPLQVNSCVRDVETQADLRERNKNAAPVAGPHASLHLRGNTVDIRRLGLSKSEQNFVRTRLRALEHACKADATEEKVQVVWHVVVFKGYDKRGSACSKKQPPRQ